MGDDSSRYCFLIRETANAAEEWAYIGSDGERAMTLYSRNEVSTFAQRLQADGWELIAVVKTDKSEEKGEVVDPESWVFEKLFSRITQ
jgi:hypothetical protein